MKHHGDDPQQTTIEIPVDKVCFLILKAREFDVKEEGTDPDSGSNPSDDAEISVLEDTPDDPVEEEIRSLIDDLSIDEQIDLVALAWLGRDDYDANDWTDLRIQATEAHNRRTADYLLGDPLLGDHLAEGLAALGYSCEDVERKYL
ncbi:MULTISPECIES: DUF3775 domain-containing protein [Alphaproteobacteria]|uniref:DUF3775 domain-containing protein n=2 Tax=Alphaproteobacteria TaxID=28211 RepID=A0A512HPW0_9HYPH|nr:MULTISPECIES: DUF3775 domain-containing protein [Alphaproteobacteria]GEO87494.1 hypothetical protein RNA01_44260 [Ciceribacter naphthalenivorans]GLR24061.1 hypothetical protein GCM10007920_38550 [Ciceribacter naphthalenivorans]GLT06917.1 hypothetical protein GCM10007926_38550 [Sphingomonas psychrolutea]